ncbi:MAG: 4-hydroxybenzoate octaprenyltransferase [Proteobacteria bacterium]|nr:4-hydroxybenzoate octaprenyltransferase [Pseudomonadota bacterium]
MLLLGRLKQYALLMRMHRPIGTLLLLWPTMVAVWLANAGSPSLKLVFIFAAGSLIMRSAGCVINDFADIEIDGHVDRTKQRPLITGSVTTLEALLLFVVLLLMGFSLILLTNPMTIALSLIAAALAALYPFTKRFVQFPQVILGAAFGWSIPMAFSASGAPLSAECWLLFFATLIWAIAYDTEYAMVDKQYDMKIGVKSTAILFGSWDKFWIGLCHIMMLSLLAAVGLRLELSEPFFIALLIALGLALYQQWLIRNRESALCFKAFLNNQWIGAVLFLGTLFSFLFS